MNILKRTVSAVVVAVFVMVMTSIFAYADDWVFVERGSVSEEYFEAAKACYDLGFLTNVYDESKAITTRGEAAVAITKIAGKYDEAMKQKDSKTYFTDIESGTELNGCVWVMNEMGIIPNGKEFNANESVTINDLAPWMVNLLGYGPIVSSRYGSNVTGYVAYAYSIGLNDGVKMSDGNTFTHEAFSQFLYNSLESKTVKVKYYAYGGAQYEITKDTLLYKLGYSKYIVNAYVTEKSAVVNGKKYNSKELDGSAVVNENLTVVDNDAMTYIDLGMKLYVKDGGIYCAIPYYGGSIIINNGATETDNPELSLKFELYGLTKYRLSAKDDKGNDVPFTDVTDEPVSYTIPVTDGYHSVSVEFASMEGTTKKTLTKGIKMNNKRNVTFVVNGEVLKTEQQGCGSTIKFPSEGVDGYWIKEWSVPKTYVIPNEDITVTANAIPLAKIKGRLLDKDGNPVKAGNGVSVNAYKSYNNNDGKVSAYTDSDGKFELTYPQGKYNLNIGNDRSVEVNATSSEVDLGDIGVSALAWLIDTQRNVESVNGIDMNIVESVIGDKGKEAVANGGKYRLRCYAGNDATTSYNSTLIEKTIKTDMGDDAAMYFFHINMSGMADGVSGQYSSYENIYELPKNIEFVINIPENLNGKTNYAIYREHTEISGDTKISHIEKITMQPNEYGEYFKIENGQIKLYARRFSLYAISCSDNEAVTKINVSVSDDKKKFTVMPANISNGNDVILALYDGDKLVDVQCMPYRGIALEFTTDKTYTSAKVMAWKDIGSFVPVCKAFN